MRANSIEDFPDMRSMMKNARQSTYAMMKSDSKFMQCRDLSKKIEDSLEYIRKNEPWYQESPSTVTKADSRHFGAETPEELRDRVNSVNSKDYDIISDFDITRGGPRTNKKDFTLFHFDPNTRKILPQTQNHVTEAQFLSPLRSNNISRKVRDQKMEIFGSPVQSFPKALPNGVEYNDIRDHAYLVGVKEKGMGLGNIDTPSDYSKMVGDQMAMGYLNQPDAVKSLWRYYTPGTPNIMFFYDQNGNYDFDRHNAGSIKDTSRIFSTPNSHILMPTILPHEAGHEFYSPIAEITSNTLSSKINPEDYGVYANEMFTEPKLTPRFSNELILPYDAAAQKLRGEWDSDPHRLAEMAIRINQIGNQSYTTGHALKNILADVFTSTGSSPFQRFPTFFNSDRKDYPYLPEFALNDTHVGQFRPILSDQDKKEVLMDYINRFMTGGYFKNNPSRLFNELNSYMAEMNALKNSPFVKDNELYGNINDKTSPAYLVSQLQGPYETVAQNQLRLYPILASMYPSTSVFQPRRVA